MKLALVIFRIHHSHGCILQTYALYKTMQRLGHQVTIIDKQQRISFTEWIKRTMRLAISRLFNDYKGPVFYIGIEPKALMKKLTPFVDEYLGNDLYRIYDYEELIGIENKGYDAFIIGSDQVWRPKYVQSISYYFLDFLSSGCNVKRIAYAPSFGTEDWEYNEEQKVLCQKLINRFNAISVREKSGVDLCKKYFDIDAERVLDPTLLLTKEDYLRVLDDKVICKEKILTYYYLDETGEKLSFMNSIACCLGLNGHRINTKTEDGNARLKDRIAPSMEEWLGGYASSEFVIVDSFHAMVFAILFNVPFIVIANAARGLARFTSLLDLLGLGERLVTDVSKVPLQLLTQHIDWDNVNSILDTERKRCLNFLKAALRD